MEHGEAIKIGGAEGLWGELSDMPTWSKTSEKGFTRTAIFRQWAGSGCCSTPGVHGPLNPWFGPYLGWSSKFVFLFFANK